MQQRASSSDDDAASVDELRAKGAASPSTLSTASSSSPLVAQHSQRYKNAPPTATKIAEAQLRYQQQQQQQVSFGGSEKEAHKFCAFASADVRKCAEPKKKADDKEELEKGAGKTPAFKVYR